MIRIPSDSPVVAVAAAEYTVKVGRKPGASPADSCYIVAFSRDGAHADVPLSGPFSEISAARRALNEGFVPAGDHPQAAAIVAALIAAGLADSR